MRLLCVFLKRELELYEEQKEAVHISYFTPFYCVAQAVFLIFCFRWRDLKEGGVGEDDDEGKEEDTDELGLNVDLSAEKTRVSSWIKELDVMQQVVVHPLNPPQGKSPILLHVHIDILHQTVVDRHVFIPH